MNRLALLIPILLCLTFEPRAATSFRGGPALFIGLIVAVVAAGRFLAWRSAEATHEGAIIGSLSRLMRLLSYSRLALLGWTGAGLYVLGWHGAGERLLGWIHLGDSAVASALFDTLPAYLGWLGLYWAQYPAEHATRDAAMLAQLEAGLPVRQGPSLARYLDHQLRIGPGALLGPMLAVLILRDVAFYALRLWAPAALTAGSSAGASGGGAGAGPGQWVDVGVYLASLLAVFVLSPMLLTYILRTYRLPDDDLRRRLEGLARRAGVKFHDILLWDTAGSMGNALVTGVIPRFRYVLLSDVLVETMNDEQIEAVFAHELGHIVHRHIAWYAAFLVSGSVLLDWFASGLMWLQTRTGLALYAEVSASLVSLLILLGAFGFLSRWSERQADVFAARAIGPGPELAPSRPLESDVAPHGAAVFGGALREVARINHMPSAAWGYLHGSIATRVETLRAMAAGEPSTRTFDLRMRLLRIGLAVIILAGAGTAILQAMSNGLTFR